MKSVIVSLFLASTMTVFAQLYPGITGGYHIATLNSKTNNRWSEAGGFRTGAFIDYPFKGHHFALRLETSYLLIRCLDEMRNDQVKLHYLSLPFSVLWQPRNHVHIVFGPQLNFLLKQQGPLILYKSTQEKMQPIDFGLQASLELFVAHNVNVAFRFYQGLGYNVRSDSTGNPIKWNRLSTIQLGLNYFFNKK